MDSDSDAASSTSSASLPPSPTLSFHGAPTTENLISHLVAAKRSLNSTSYVSRASELVNASRTLVEEIAVLNAKNEFARRGVDEQVDTLSRVKVAIVDQSEVVETEFRATIERLDKANDRLQGTLQRLRATVVDTSLRKPGGSLKTVGTASGNRDVVATDSRPAELEQQTLFGFIDETNHTDLEISLRGLIDSYNDSRSGLDTTIEHFEDSIKTINNILTSRGAEDALDKRTLYDEPPPTTTHLFRSIEEHSAEMAHSLHSLVAHYDLCVTALRHTEGAGEAVKRANLSTGSSTEKASVGGKKMDESLHLKNIPEPISDEDRTEMLRVLETDAHQVEDVVMEIRDRNREQEDLFTQLSNRTKHSRTTMQNLNQALEMLHEMQDIHIPTHLHALSTFKSTWTRTQSSIASQTDALASLSTFYEEFLAGYAKLLREVDRRAAAEQQMRKVADKARRDLDRLWEADREQREQFMEVAGQVLPAGIWEGLEGKGKRWDVEELVAGKE